jgi:hypothetical protein
MPSRGSTAAVEFVARLDIVRKPLGPHGIATVQASTVHRATEMVNLTAMLSGSAGGGEPRRAPSAALRERPLCEVHRDCIPGRAA